LPINIVRPITHQIINGVGLNAQPAGGYDRDFTCQSNMPIFLMVLVFAGRRDAPSASGVEIVYRNDFSPVML
jgi:hypothetical protein